MSVKFQDNILKLIDNTTFDTFPQSLMLVGKPGSGRHSLCELTGAHLRVDTVNITSEVNLSSLRLLEASVSPTMCLIEADNLSEREQNILLKFIEEPSKYIKTVIICNNLNSVIPTLAGRCVIWELNKYTKEQLATFCPDPEVLELCETPGDVIKFSVDKEKIAAMNDLCVNIFTHLGNANLPNALLIVNKLGFKDEPDRFDVDCFFKILLRTVSGMIKSGVKDIKLQKAYDLTKDLNINSSVAHVNKQLLFENYLVTLKMLLMGV